MTPLVRAGQCFSTSGPRSWDKNILEYCCQDLQSPQLGNIDFVFSSTVCLAAKAFVFKIWRLL